MGERDGFTAMTVLVDESLMGLRTGKAWVKAEPATNKTCQGPSLLWAIPFHLPVGVSQLVGTGIFMESKNRGTANSNQ